MGDLKALPREEMEELWMTYRTEKSMRITLVTVGKIKEKFLYRPLKNIVSG